MLDGPALTRRAARGGARAPAPAWRRAVPDAASTASCSARSASATRPPPPRWCARSPARRRSGPSGAGPASTPRASSASGKRCGGARTPQRPTPNAQRPRPDARRPTPTPDAAKPTPTPRPTPDARRLQPSAASSSPPSPARPPRRPAAGCRCSSTATRPAPPRSPPPGRDPARRRGADRQPPVGRARPRARARASWGSSRSSTCACGWARPRGALLALPVDRGRRRAAPRDGHVRGVRCRPRAADAHDAGRGPLADAALAVAFLTIVPVRRARPGDAEPRRAAAWFPLVGAAVGALGGRGRASRPSRLLGAGRRHRARRSSCSCALTGALHQDGLADTRRRARRARRRRRAAAWRPCATPPSARSACSRSSRWALLLARRSRALQRHDALLALVAAGALVALGRAPARRRHAARAARRPRRRLPAAAPASSRAPPRSPRPTLAARRRSRAWPPSAPPLVVRARHERLGAPRARRPDRRHARRDRRPRRAGRMRGPPGGVWLRFPTRDHAYRSSQRDRGGGAPGRPRPRGGAQAEGQGPRDRGRVRRCRRRPAARRAVHRGRRDHRRPWGADVVVKVAPPSAEEVAELGSGAHADRLPRAAHEPRGRPGAGQRRRDRDRHGGRSRASRAPSPWTRSPARPTSAATASVLLAGTLLRRFYPMLMTAAGTVPPGQGAGARRRRRRAAGHRHRAPPRRRGRGLRRALGGQGADRVPGREVRRARHGLRRRGRGRLRAPAHR